MKRGKSEFDPLREVTDMTTSALLDEYALTDTVDEDAATSAQVQAEILEAMHRLGPQVFDDTEKEQVMKCLIRAAGLVDMLHGVETEFEVEIEDVEVDNGTFQFTRTVERVVVDGDSGECRSAFHDDGGV